jgi:endonuclease/exonuclease/phosphatase family metal-dependent hydrolase
MVGGADSMLRVCTWNINLGVRLDEVLDVVSAHRDFAGLDLFALQEASVHHGHPDGHALAELLGPDYECHQVTAQTIRGHVQANAMIWNRRRVDVRGVGHLRLPGGRSLYKQQRNSVVVEGEFGRVPLLAYSVHLDIFGATHKRQQLLDVMADRLARPPADVTIVAGDLNMFHLSRWPSWSKLIEAYEAEGFTDAARRIGWTHSHRALPIRQKLDSILVRSPTGVKLRSWTVEVRGSDHIPLFADVMLR